MKPMLAGTWKDTPLQFPLLASPKLDGVRALVIDSVVMSRNLKPIPNRFIQELWGRPEFNGLDGELGVGHPTDKDFYRNTVSAVMSQDGVPEIAHHIFDDYLHGAQGAGFQDRYAALHTRVMKLRQCHVADHRCTIVGHDLILNLEELNGYEAAMLNAGYEGAMIRSMAGPYKQGRSTEREGYLLKVKRFHDSEAVIVGFDEKWHNANVATINELGRTHRSSHKAGKQLTGVLGAIKVRGVEGQYKDVLFDIGTGFDDCEREHIWDNQDAFVGKMVRYKFFPTGSKDKPRFPTFLGFSEKGVL